MNTIHEKYEEKLKRTHDFLVHYTLIANQDEYTAVLRQGMRSDFCYEEDADVGPVHMIWPEFENSDGEIITNKDAFIEAEGTARMWIMLEETRSYHKKRIEVGTKGFLVFGSHKIAGVEVTEL